LADGEHEAVAVIRDEVQEMRRGAEVRVRDLEGEVAAVADGCNAAASSPRTFCVLSRDWPITDALGSLGRSER
jgi:hypothetical protein